MIELRWYGLLTPRLQYRQRVVRDNPPEGAPLFEIVWSPWTDVPSVPDENDKLPDKE